MHGFSSRFRETTLRIQRGEDKGLWNSVKEGGRLKGVEWRGGSSRLPGGGCSVHLRLRYKRRWKILTEGQHPLPWAVLLTSRCLHRDLLLLKERKVVCEW